MTDFIPKKVHNKNLHIPPRLKIAAAHTLDTSNVGDLMCVPAQYMNFPGSMEYVDIHDAVNNLLLTPENFDATIFGGGDSEWILTHPMYSPRVTTKSNIAWGLGAYMKTRLKGPLLDKFQLIGIRAWNHPDIDNKKIFYVPCPSCMSRLFDLPLKKPEHRYVLYMHKVFTHYDVEGHAPLMTNYDDFVSAIEFLSSAEIVVTNSYHGAYWATLLGRKVIVISPPNNVKDKAKTLKYKPVFATKDNWREALDSSELKSYPEALSECRNVNINFYGKVLDLLNKLP